MDLEDKEFWKSQINLGLSRFFLLMVISRGAIHGYGAVQELEELTKGCCAPTLGTVYPVLSDMEKEGYVTSLIDVTGSRKRKLYSLTARGERAYQAALEAWREIMPILEKALEKGARPTKHR